MDHLQRARAEINEVDAEMAKLFERRMAAVRQVLEYKRAHGLPVLDAGREQEVLARAAAQIEDPALRGYYTRVVERLMEVSRAFQSRQLEGFRVGYPGVEGAFSHIAASRIFPGRSQQSFVTFGEVFAAVQSGAVDVGVVPFENSYTGEVGEVLDLLWRHNCYIIGRYDLEIRQNLLALPGARLEDLRQVYSHHQAISQCQSWLSGQNFEVIPYPNTALAAKYVSECADKTKGAIASADTAALYGLSVLAADINTSAQNVTRFILISKTPPAGGDRFALVFTVRHDAGALAKAMQIIGGRGFNLESIRSRSMKELPWQYYFYAEAVGDPSSAAVMELLEELSGACSELKLLGGWQGDRKI